MGTKANPKKGRIQKYVADSLREMKESKKPFWLTIDGNRVLIQEDIRDINRTPYYGPDMFLIAYDGRYYIADVYDKDRGYCFTYKDGKEFGSIKDWKKKTSFKFLAQVVEIHPAGE